MDSLDIQSVVDHQRWLMNSGLFNDKLKDNLWLFGAILHNDIEHVGLHVDVTDKSIVYDLYVTPSLFKDFKKFNELRKSDSRLSLWRLKRLLQRHASLDFKSLVAKMVTDLCGPTWTVSVKVLKSSEYNKDEKPDAVAENTGANK